mgnify:FL=1
MSKLKEELKSDASMRFGPDAMAVIDYLFDMGTLNDISARNHMVKVRVFDRMLTTKESGRLIAETVSDDYPITPTYVYMLTNSQR